LQIFKIIQVGDVHYTDLENTTSPVDNKDPGFPGALSAAIGTTPLQSIFRAVARCIEEEGPEVVAFMGDFTNRGDTQGLNDCLNYLRGLFPTNWGPGSAPTCQLLIGNHDVDRKKDPETEDRYHDINVAIQNAGFPCASVLQPEELVFGEASAAELRVYGINSSRGCGQVRLLGGLLAKLAGPEIERILREGGSQAQLDEIYEGIDTPAIDDATLRQLREAISGLPETAMPVICAHHNILPQTTPRIAPYSELINAGSIRAGLLMLNRPIIFLHGHLHDDPVEIIRSPSHPRSAIISISAPILRDGFNVVTIAHNEDGVPLGCQVTRHRRSGSHVERLPPQPIAIWGGAEGLGMVSANGRELMRRLSPDQVSYPTDLLSATGWAAQTLYDVIEELRWLGLLQVHNSDRPRNHWRVARAV
jgi:hypothetical protein